MIILEIVSVDNYKYECIDEVGHNYNIYLEFFDIEKKPKVRRLYTYE